MIYLDTSVLLKRYYQEADSEQVRRIVARADRVATASLSYAEFFSGLHRKLRQKEIQDEQYHRAAEAFDSEWQHLAVVPLSDEVLRRTRRLIELYALRAGDAIQLAAALTLAMSLPIQFASADQRLNHAAGREGLALL